MPQSTYGRSYGSNPAQTYERFFVPNIGQPVADNLLAIAAPAVGERVLDVACGTGVVTRALATRVGAGGRVAGLDPTGAMLDVARAHAPAEPVIEWHQAAAESMPFDDDCFDLITCQMGLQFFDDRLAGLREMRRVLAPGGRLALNVPGPMPALFREMAEVIGERVGPEPASFCHVVFSMHDAEELRELASQAGFREIEVRHEPIPLEVPAPAAFLWGYIHCTPMTAHFAEVDDADCEAFEQEVVARFAPFVRGNGMRFPVGISTLTCR